jgi:hypothetical protein
MDGKGRQGGFVEELLSNNLTILESIVQHKEIDQEFGELLMFICHSVECVFRGVDGL